MGVVRRPDDHHWRFIELLEGSALPERFPNDFRFELTRDKIIRVSQIVTSSEIKY